MGLRRLMDPWGLLLRDWGHSTYFVTVDTSMDVGAAISKIMIASLTVEFCRSNGVFPLSGFGFSL